MDKESLPRWGWLLLGLFAAAITASMLNVVVLHPIGLPLEYNVVTTITLMAPVLIYVGIWYDDHRQGYWEHSQAKIIGDVLFALTGALLGAGIVLAVIVDAGLPTWVRDIFGMIGGFLAAWGLFWWRNTDLYGEEE